MRHRIGNVNLFDTAFILGNNAIALTAGPWYVFHYGMPASILALTVFYVLASGLSITVGYHRLFAHATFKTNKFVRFWLLFFGASTFQMSALTWCSQHRAHHQFVDTDRDPYSIKKGFFWAHMGWIFFGKNKLYYDNAEDLLGDPLVMKQAKNYLMWAVVSGIVTPTVLGALMGHPVAGFIFGVSVRLSIVYHSTWLINSACHTFGKATYDLGNSSRDHWLLGILTMGEGYHNFHHRFPSDYRNGVRWYDIDISKWVIASLEKLGLARDLKRIEKSRILAARRKIITAKPASPAPAGT